MFALRPCEMTLELTQMIMWKNPDNRAAQSGAVDERRMTKFVQQNNIALRDQRRQCPDRGGISAAKTERGLRSFPFCQRCFQTQMRGLRSADQARRARADAKFADSGNRRFAQSGIVRQAEIIIGGKINQPFADKIDNWALGAADFAKMSI